MVSRPDAHTCFGVSLFAGFTRREVRKALEGAGVNAWGFEDDAGRYAIIFNVQEDHTQLALDTLEEAQVPVLYPKWSTKKASNNFLVRLFEAIERYA